MARVIRMRWDARRRCYRAAWWARRPAWVLVFLIAAAWLLGRGLIAILG